jgi:hypothetical protein
MSIRPRNLFDRLLRLLVPGTGVLLPWGYAYAPDVCALWVLGLGVAAVGVGWTQRASLGPVGRWGVLAAAAFLGLQGLSLLNPGEVHPGTGHPGSATLGEALMAWLPGTVAPGESLRWWAWWAGTLGVMGWLAVSPLRRADVERGLAVFWIGACLTIGAGLLGKAGYLLPGFTDHHGVWQPFAYRNHGVAYAVLGLGAGGTLAVLRWKRSRWQGVTLACLVIVLAAMLPLSQSRFAFVPQLFFAAALISGLVRGFGAGSARWLARPVVRWGLVAATGVGLATLWVTLGLTGRMNDTYRQLRLVAEGNYPDLRLPAAGTAAEAGWARLPWGWGAGAYPEVLPLFAGAAFYSEAYQPETKNFGKLIPTVAAHNDLLEWWMEFGALGLALLAVALWGLRPRHRLCVLPGWASPDPLRFALAAGGFFVLFDYPLHYPPTFWAFGVLAWLAWRLAPGALQKESE